MAATSSVPGRDRGDQGELRRFRNDFHDCLTTRPDALFELVDGLSQAIPVAGIAHLSLAAGAQRGHGSAYAAIAKGDLDEDQVRDVLAAHRPAGQSPDFAIDTSTWPRPDAERSPGRGYYHQRHPRARSIHGEPIVAGWDFSWLCALSTQPDSWTTPLDIRCRTVGDNINTIAVAQITALLPRLGQLPLDPLFAHDAGYDPVQLTVGLADTPAQIVVRIRNDRVFFTRAPQPPPLRGKPGRPKRHGTRFHCAHPASWPTPDLTGTHHDKRYGHVEVMAWQNLHPETQNTYRDPDGKPTIVEATIIRLRVERLPGHTGHPTTMWLWWAGPEGSIPDLNRIWRAYLHRFDIEHTFRFAKQVLGWTTPKIRTPQQARRWTWLIVAAYTQLRLARHLVADHRMPWQPHLPAHKMTPGRVRAGFHHLLPKINTPASCPKPSRPGPGRPKGRKSTPATRYPPLKTTDVKPPKR